MRQILLIALCFWATISKAEPIEIQKLEEILPHIEAGTTVVLDLDNTVFTANQMIGSDQWYSHLEKKYLAEGSSAREASMRAGREVQEVHLKSEVSLIEEGTRDLIRALQKKGVTVIALTARSPGLIFRTRNQLAQVGIDFSSSAPGNFSGPLTSDGHSLAHEGIIFVGPNNKGEVLDSYLKHSLSHPKKILFVDDKIHNTSKLEAALEAKAYKVQTFRYGGADSVVQKFDPAVVDAAHAHYLSTHEILSDEAARAKLLKSPGNCETGFEILRN